MGRESRSVGITVHVVYLSCLPDLVAVGVSYATEVGMLYYSTLLVFMNLLVNRGREKVTIIRKATSDRK